MKRTSTLKLAVGTCIGLFMGFAASAQLIYSNGAAFTHSGTGSGGADESVLQNNSIGHTTLGAGHQLTAFNRIGDDMVITDVQWTIDSIIFYAYQTGSGNNSTITEVNIRIWDGVPDASTVVFGDTLASLMYQTYWSNIYRVTEVTTGTATDRPMMRQSVDIGQLVLTTGTYWLDWQADGSSSSGPWAPPLTITGQAVTGNAMQRINGSWTPIQDGGTGDGFDFPYEVWGSVVVGEETLDNVKAFHIYPNPATNVLNVNVKLAEADDLLIQVFNVLGEIVYSVDKANGTMFAEQIDITNLEAGIYMVQLNAGDQKITRRIVKN